MVYQIIIPRYTTQSLENCQFDLRMTFTHMNTIQRFGKTAGYSVDFFGLSRRRSQNLSLDANHSSGPVQTVGTRTEVLVAQWPSWL
jgi:hypothetical protein